jgi:hypothetical protein
MATFSERYGLRSKLDSHLTSVSGSESIDRDSLARRFFKQYSRNLTLPKFINKMQELEEKRVEFHLDDKIYVPIRMDDRKEGRKLIIAKKVDNDFPLLSFSFFSSLIDTEEHTYIMSNVMEQTKDDDGNIIFRVGIQPNK